MIIEERKYNKKVHIICEKLMESAGWKIERPIPQAKVQTRQGGTVLLARDEISKEYLGFCRIINTPWYEIWIEEVCVNPKWQRKGIGKALINKIVELAKGKIILAWGVDKGSEFFNALGFKLSKAPVYFYKTDRE